ncbi:MAG: hypothetical protein GY913_31275 [Proteobacteria bacterium]|nr:hypothetical protein [Pseudomonadota bacterium]MCP4921401.1 hypothetical protein [Pseudomonadota bacterium]
MSILLPFVVSVAHAVEFEVGAGAELVAYTAPDVMELDLRQAEIGGYLDFEVAALRADFEVNGLQRTLAPEWAAVVADAGQWELGVGFQPLPAGTEHTDAWRNPFIVPSLGMNHHPGGILGLRANRHMDAPVVPSLWGGVRSGIGQTIGDPLIGGGVQVGDVDAIHGRVSLNALPTVWAFTTHAAIVVPVGEVATLGADGHGGFEANKKGGALGAYVVLLPEKIVSPVARAGWTSGQLVAVDAGILSQPHESFRVLATGRVEGQEWGIYASVALFDEREQPDLWALR